MRIESTALRFRYGSRLVLDGIDLDLDAPGRVHAVIGPNAAGKSTLLRCLAGLLRTRGAVFLDGRPVEAFRPGERAKLVAYLPQDLPNTAALTVFEAVLVARRQGESGWRVGGEDIETVHAVLSRLGLAELAMRHLTELSGGQRQLVAVAQALAGAPQVLLLDEPTSSLDLHHQLDLLAMVASIATERAMTVFIAIHDLNLAARLADRMLVLADGRIVAAGAPAEVLTPTLLRRVYRVHARVLPGEDGVPIVVPMTALPPEPTGTGTDIPPHASTDSPTRQEAYAAHD